MTEVKEGMNPPEPTGLAKLKDTLVEAPFGGVEHQAFNDFLDRTAAEMEADSGFSVTPTATKLDRDTIKETARKKLALLQLQTSKQSSTLMGYRLALNSVEEAYQTAKNTISQDRNYSKDELLYKRLREFQNTLGTEKAQSFDFFSPEFLGSDYDLSGEDTKEYINQLIQEGVVSKPTTLLEITGNADPVGMVFKLGDNGFEIDRADSRRIRVRTPQETQGDFVLFILKRENESVIPFVAPLRRAPEELAKPDDAGKKESGLGLISSSAFKSSPILFPLSAIDEKTVAETPFLLKGIQNACIAGGNHYNFAELLAEPNINPRIKAVIESARRQPVRY